MIRQALRRLRRRHESTAIPGNWLETSLMRDFLDFSGLSPERVLGDVRDFRSGVSKEWFASGASFDARAATFYSRSQLYVYDLLTTRKNYDDTHFEEVSAPYLAYLKGARAVLEFGGGVGSACLWFARQPGVERVYYYDVAPAHREFAAFRFGRHDKRRAIRIVDRPEDLPEQVELVYSDAVLEHVVDPIDTVNRLFPVVATGGHLVLLVDAAPDKSGMFPMHRPVDMRAVVLRSVLKVMQLRHEQHRWAFSVWRKEAIAPTDLAGAQLAPLRVTFLLPDTGAWGGIRQVYSLAEALAQRGHTVRLMARGERPANLDPKVEFHTVERYQPATAASVPPSDFIIGTWHNTVPVALAVAAAHPNALALHYSQGYESAFPEQARRRGAIERVYRLPTLKVTPCPKMVGELRLRFGQEPAYLPQFVASREFAPGRRAFAQDGYIWVLIVGPFETAWKGIETAVRGIALVQREMPAIRLRRVSQFPMPAAEKALHTPDEFHVGVDAARMAELMRDSDLFVSASLEDEGFGLPALEALRCGLPCVLSRISAYLTFDPERADYALFATPGDPNAFAQALRELIADEGRRQRFTRRGVEVAARYFDGSNTPVLWERYLQTLKQLAPQLAALQRGRTS